MPSRAVQNMESVELPDTVSRKGKGSALYDIGLNVPVRLDGKGNIYLNEWNVMSSCLFFDPRESE